MFTIPQHISPEKFDKHEETTVINEEFDRSIYGKVEGRIQSLIQSNDKIEQNLEQWLVIFLDMISDGEDKIEMIKMLFNEA